MKSYKPTNIRRSMSTKPENYDEFISLIGSERTRPEFPYYKIRRNQTIHFYQERLNSMERNKRQCVRFSLAKKIFE